jgi:hypothetical protein
MSKMEIIVLSAPDREDLFAELYEGDELWDRDAAHPIIEYDDHSEALAFVATTVARRGDAAVASWCLLRALPNGDETETIAIGANLARLAKDHAVSA